MSWETNDPRDFDAQDECAHEECEHEWVEVLGPGNPLAARHEALARARWKAELWGERHTAWRVGDPRDLEPDFLPTAHVDDNLGVQGEAFFLHLGYGESSKCSGGCGVWCWCDPGVPEWVLEAGV